MGTRVVGTYSLFWQLLGRYKVLKIAIACVLDPGNRGSWPHQKPPAPTEYKNHILKQMKEVGRLRQWTSLVKIHTYHIYTFTNIVCIFIKAKHRIYYIEGSQVPWVTDQSTREETAAQEEISEDLSSRLQVIIDQCMHVMSLPEAGERITRRE